MEAINTYIEEIKAQLSSGYAREHGYRPALERLMRSFEDTQATNDPKRSEHGNPDFIFAKKSNHDIILGYAEAKDITIDLDKTVKTEQLRRYAGYEKLFLTNYLDFRFFRNGEEYKSISIGYITNQQIVFDKGSFGCLMDELQAFLDLPPEKIKSGKHLALIMGGKARRIRDNVNIYLGQQDKERNYELEKIFNMMKFLLVHDLTAEKFADMYAQTLVYGLFVARYNDETPESFTRSEARELVPASNPFLREFFDHIVGPRFDSRLSQIVDELCSVFSVSNVHILIQKHLRLFEVEDEKDPIIHFYEDFLKEYDPEMRKKMGAYYTPVPVVRFIIRQVDEILKKEFGLSKGLADTSKITKEFNIGQKVHIRNPKTGKIERTNTIQKEFHRVQVLDPAVGTATFLNEAIKHIYKSFEGQEGRWPAYVEQDLLPRLHGFELMMAPYTIAHLKLGMTLQETGVTEFKQRIGVYLTNTLEEGIKRQQDLFSFGLAEMVSWEAEEAAKIKHEKPIMVIIGNPPYSGESSNKTEYASSLVSKYKFEPGGQQKLQERNPKWINDDYVKFIAFAEDMVVKNDGGILAMITNHSYLDNPTFRGMRWHLAQNFDKIYVLDLHGNSKKQEISPDGSKDENVFDIQQGVAILIAIKSNENGLKNLSDVYHADIFGLRKSKFSLLEKEIKWKSIELDKKMLYFAPKNIEGKLQYDKGHSLDELFNIYSVGIVTAADRVLVNDSSKQLLETIDYAKNEEGKSKLINRLKNHEVSAEYIRPLVYRPFDKRYIYYASGIIERLREKVMKHFLNGNNIGLIASGQNRQASLGYFFITSLINDFHVLDSVADSTSTFPLYLYHDDGKRTPNFNINVLKRLTINLKKPYEPEDILDYIYAILHSPKYRKIYKEFLKIDFPRIPAPKNDTEFKKFSGFGKQLRELHLMASPILNILSTTFPETGNNYVERVSYGDGKVWLNKSQYFGKVPEAAWNFYIGGYQPAQKWLKDRKGKKLSNTDIEHYQKIIKILYETNKLMDEIDTIDWLGKA